MHSEHVPYIAHECVSALALCARAHTCVGGGILWRAVSCAGSCHYNNIWCPEAPGPCGLGYMTINFCGM